MFFGNDRLPLVRAAWEAGTNAGDVVIPSEAREL
jgi:hypothetical protein